MLFRRVTFPILIAITVAACSKPVEKMANEPVVHDVVILPTEEFPQSEATKLAAMLAEDTGLSIKVVLPLGTQDWKPFADRPQYDADGLLNIAQPAIERLKGSYGGEVYVILTSRDIGVPDKSLNFVFSWNDHARKLSVVSAARMLWNEGDGQATDEVVRTRLHKMLLRIIALQYYGLPRSADISEVTYSPLMSVGDLDEMGLTLRKPE